MVRIHPDPPAPEPWPGNPDRGRGGKQNGAVAQLGERLLCKQEAVGSIPSSSTSQQQQAVADPAAGPGSPRIRQHLSVAVQDSGQRW